VLADSDGDSSEEPSVSPPPHAVRLVRARAARPTAQRFFSTMFLFDERQVQPVVVLGVDAC
jgi:hypothetical protein